MNQILQPFKRLFSNQQFLVMLTFFVAVALLIVFFGKMIAPFLAAIVVAYLLEGVIVKLTQFGLRRFFSVLIVFLLFSLFVCAVLFIVFPLIIDQGKDFASNLPGYVNVGQELIMKLPEKYPEIISLESAQSVLDAINTEIKFFAQNALSGGVVAPIVGFVTLAIYLILVPVMVFFMLKDKKQIIAWLARYLPFDNPVLKTVWKDVDMQIGNYIRGKFTEIIVIWFVSFIAFAILGLNYALLLSFMVGLSVLIPYIGATVVTIPVLLVGFFQWGIGSEFLILSIVYLVIQIIDGNVLVPLIFSEAVNIHPIAIIVAVLIFGGLWGFWGVFFAIPLATVVKAVMNAWTDSDTELESKV